VSKIKPFRALRPTEEAAEQVSCVPYDVIGQTELRRLANENPSSFLRVTRAEADFDETASPESDAVFEQARANLQRMIAEGVLQQDGQACVYVYRLSRGSHVQTGVAACCSLDEYENGLIKKHENVRPDKVEDRTRHMVALRAQTGLILLTYRGTEKINALVAEAVKTDPVYDFGCAATIRNTVWRIDKADDFISAFAAIESLYVADGHHRLEAANQARRILEGENARHTGAEDYNFVMAGMFRAEELEILPYNRAVRSLNGMTTEEFLKRARENFIVSESEEKSPREKGMFSMYVGGRWYTLRLNINFFRAPDLIDSLDVSVLQTYLLAPVLGLQNILTDDRIEFVGGIHGPGELEKLVDDGKAAVAFSMYPTSVEDLFKVSDMNDIMPPKSTWFEPKLRDGLLIHLI
jgi:uncharacterized protein (DUF1015 family)